MIVRDGQPFAPPFFYAACPHCGWCGSLRVTELAAGRDDDAHLAAKLAARSSLSTESPGGGGRPGS